LLLICIQGHDTQAFNGVTRHERKIRMRKIVPISIAFISCYLLVMSHARTTGVAPAFLVSNDIYKPLVTNAPHFHIRLHPRTTLILKLPRHYIHYNILVRYSHMHTEPLEVIRSSTTQLVVFSRILLLPYVACKPWIM